MTSRRSASAVHRSSTAASGELADIKRIQLAEASSSSQPVRATHADGEQQRSSSRPRKPLTNGNHHNSTSGADDGEDPDASSSTVARSPSGTQHYTQDHEDDDDEDGPTARVKRRKTEPRSSANEDNGSERDHDDTPAVKQDPDIRASEGPDRPSTDDEGDGDALRVMDSQPDPSSSNLGPRDSRG